MFFAALFLTVFIGGQAVAAPAVRPVADAVGSSMKSQMQSEALDKKVSERDLTPVSQEDAKTLDDIRKEIEKLKPAKKKNETQFVLKKIDFEGNTIYPTALLQEIAAPLIGKKVGISEVRNLCEIITKKYHYDGYLTSYAFLPGQTIKNGTLKVVVSETKINKINIQNNRWANTQYLLNNYFTPNGLEPNVLFNLSNLDNVMGEISQEEYLRGKFTLSDEKHTGQTNILFDANDRFPIDADISFDNYGRDVVGKNRVTATVADNNVTGYGDRLYVGTVQAKGTQGWLAGYAVPIYQTGTTLTVDYSRSKVEVGKEMNAFDISGVSENIMAGATQTLYKTKNSRINLRVGLDFISTDSTLGLINVKTTDYKLRILRTSLYGMFDDSRGRSFASAGYDVGIKGMGARAQPGAGVPDMTNYKVTGSVMRFQRLGKGFSAMIRANGQWTPKALYPVEQFQLGGFGSLRGYETGVLIADYGVAGSAELRFPLWGLNKVISEENAARFKGFGFYDFGCAKEYDHAYNYERNFLSSVGAGVSFSANRLTFNVAYGYPVEKSSFKKARWLFFVSTDIDSWFFN